MKRKYDIGEKIGRLTLLEYLHTDHANKRLVKCICSCGKELITRINNLGRKTNSCGCLKADLIKERMGKSIEHRVCMATLNSCKRKTKDTDLSLKDVKVLIFNKCYYCEESIEIVGKIFSHNKRSIKRIGIDRIDNLNGYYKNNVISCCQSCNTLKRDYQIDVLIIKLSKFFKNLKKLKTNQQLGRK